ncbi:MAG: IS1595 family transposase [Clostridia bacterium]|nr:IS1595 family transposase [Clostridia bacterium]
MKQNILVSFESETKKALQTLKSNVEKINIKAQRKAIDEDSPYSERITSAINHYDELCLYNNLKLKEAFVNRPALIKDIDWDLFVTSENMTNRELIKKGVAPYAYDDKDGKIEIHHIGQAYDAPFVELTVKEHMQKGNNRILHKESQDSWRNEPGLEQAFENEKDRYWRARVAGNYSVKEMRFDELNPFELQTPKSLSADIRDTIEFLFTECSVDDLNYLKDSAESCALVKEVGIESISDFLNNGGHKKEEQYSPDCPRCGSKKHVYYGAYTVGTEEIQRYRCKDCQKTFNAFNNSILSNSNLNLTDWMKFINCMYHGYTVEEIARVCNISEKTVQFNKNKLFYALKILDDKVKLNGNIVIDETYQALSFKGSLSWKNDCKMPRKPRKRGKEIHKRGTSDEQVSIVCALDSNGNSVAHVSGCSNPKAIEIEKAIINSIDIENTDCIFGDGEKAMTKFARDNNLIIKQDMLAHKKKKKNIPITKEGYIINNYLEKMNSYHSRVKKYLGKLQNPASRTLQGYLYLFAWKERNKDRDMQETYQELLQIMLSPCSINTEELKKGLFLPDPYELEEFNQMPQFKNRKKALRICKAYSSGQTMKEIADNENCTVQNISKTIQKGKKLGYVERTEKEKYYDELDLAVYGVELITRLLEEQGLLLSPTMRRNIDIYEAKKNWTGSPAKFDKKMMKKYNIGKRQTVKNIITKMKTIEKLKAEFYIFEDFDYINLKEKYKKVFERYQSIRICNPEMQKGQIIDILSDEYNYSAIAIKKIIKTMSEPNEEFWRKKHRLSPSETLNRNKALFVDLLKWEGSLKEFCDWAAKKYSISKGYVTNIIGYCLIANPKRRDQV